MDAKSEDEKGMIGKREGERGKRKRCSRVESKNIFLLSMDSGGWAAFFPEFRSSCIDQSQGIDDTIT